LKNCSGVLFPGQTHFIMGASGAGKTSLLNVLSDRIGLKQGDSLSGDIKLNDRYTLNQNTFGRFANYVMQDDIIFRYFTVREALTFAARLKLKISEGEQDKRIQKLIDDLGLSQVSEL
jgi:ABC-type multidrug transport system ATPase subunit